MYIKGGENEVQTLLQNWGIAMWKLSQVYTTNPHLKAYLMIVCEVLHQIEYTLMWLGG